MLNIKIIPYNKKYDKSCTELEKLCVHGTSYVIRFEREIFRKRSEAYENWHILLGLDNETVVSTASCALKKIKFHKKEYFASYIYDLRVHPDYRGKSIMKTMVKKIIDYSVKQGAQLTYCIIDNTNMAPQTIFKKHFNHTAVSENHFLVWPIYKKMQPKKKYEKSTPEFIFNKQVTKWPF